MHSIKLKFGIFISQHHTTFIGICDCRTYSIFHRNKKKNILMHFNLQTQIIKRVLASKQFFGIELKFDEHIIGHCHMSCIDFGE